MHLEAPEGVLGRVLPLSILAELATASMLTIERCSRLVGIDDRPSGASKFKNKVPRQAKNSAHGANKIDGNYERRRESTLDVSDVN